MNLTYKIIDDGRGYIIMNDGVDWIVQSDYIPFKAASMEESAKLHIENILKSNEQTQAEIITIEKLQKQIDLQNQAIAELTMIIAK